MSSRPRAWATARSSKRSSIVSKTIAWTASEMYWSHRRSHWRLVEIDGRRGIALVQIEHVDLGVVVDVLESG